jgi:ubiquinone/menaquinone biosynthesis C-methylase UbiE/DNA-binding transcriptional MerR regulator
MPEKNLYTTGEFAKRANVSVRTIRYYDEAGLLKPTIIKDSGYRFYTDSDFAILQKIIVLKRLGFSLEEISGISRNGDDSGFVKESFELQRKLIQEKITELKQIEQAILEVSQTVTDKAETDWSKIISLIHLTSMEETLEKQYMNSKNIDARIELHREFSTNTQGWFRWIYHHLQIMPGMNILETGCGNGQLWEDNLGELSDNARIYLTDISSGMLRNAKRKLKSKEDLFTYQCFNFNAIPYPDESFDVVIANHVLFYAKDREKTLKELYRVLKKGGVFCCSTYGRQHMKEIELLVKEYDDRIALSEVKLYDIFGLDNGRSELSSLFTTVEMHRYEDCLLVTKMQPLVDYIYSCHGNQLHYLNGQQDRFEKYLTDKLGRKGIHITKDAGIFCCYK